MSNSDSKGLLEKAKRQLNQLVEERGKEIKDYFASFKDEELYDLGIIGGVNIDNILSADETRYVISLLESVKYTADQASRLKRMIINNFVPKNGEMLPTDPRIQAIIKTDYRQKSFAVDKALQNEHVKYGVERVNACDILNQAIQNEGKTLN